ncbi:hypothetical protein IMX07_04295 [bacterium]|nr:hypothetical protein [bacterium]
MTIFGGGAKIDPRAGQAKRCRRSRGGGLAFEINERRGALGPRFARPVGRVAADSARDPAQGRIVGVGRHLKNRIVIAVQRFPELGGQKFAKIDRQFALNMQTGGSDNLIFNGDAKVKGNDAAFGWRFGHSAPPALGGRVLQYTRNLRASMHQRSASHCGALLWIAIRFYFCRFWRTENSYLPIQPPRSVVESLLSATCRIASRAAFRGDSPMSALAA